MRTRECTSNADRNARGYIVMIYMALPYIIHDSNINPLGSMCLEEKAPDNSAHRRDDVVSLKSLLIYTGLMRIIIIICEN